ncbi:MAG TPA: hypothetical protein VHQ65_04170, partial [Thermoanaerobaculia bacterium]|nr:hypothetical protein [Thermoanaerobaculia bacterium]
PPEATARELLAAEQAAGRLPADLPADRLLELFERFRHNLEAARTYRPEGVIPGDALLVRAAAGAPGVVDAAGWRRRIAGSVEVLELPADHHGLLRPPVVGALADWLAEWSRPREQAAC